MNSMSFFLATIHVLFIMFNNWTFDVTNKNLLKEQKTTARQFLFDYKTTIKMNENSSSLDLNTLWVEYKNPDGRVSYYYII